MGCNQTVVSVANANSCDSHYSEVLVQNSNNDIHRNILMENEPIVPEDGRIHRGPSSHSNSHRHVVNMLSKQLTIKFYVYVHAFSIIVLFSQLDSRLIIAFIILNCKN